MTVITQGRRVATFAELERGGDYCLVEDNVVRVDPETQEPAERRPTVFFLLPTARDEDVHGPMRSVHQVQEPPHVFRHCDDGSIEIRESIGCGPASSTDTGYYWHGYLDEGHIWRQV